MQPYNHTPAIQEKKISPQLSAGLVLCFYFLKGLKYKEPSLYCIIYFFSLDVFLCLILFISLPDWLCVTSLCCPKNMKPLLLLFKIKIQALTLTTLMLWNWWGKSQCRHPLSRVCACAPVWTAGFYPLRHHDPHHPYLRNHHRRSQLRARAESQSSRR